MKIITPAKMLLHAVLIGALVPISSASAQTEGSVALAAKINDTGSGPKHWTVVWVTDGASGAFVRTIRRQGPGYRTHWSDHCDVWYSAVAGISDRYNVSPDGFTGATATSYSAPGNPFTQTWDCKDASGATVPDGDYKIWIQYAENTNQPGPVTTQGLLWTKGPAASTVHPANQGSSFTNMSIEWTPGSVPPPVTGPEIAVQQPAGSDMVDGSSKRNFGVARIGQKGITKTFTIRNAGTAALTGLSITKTGADAKDFKITALGAASLAAGAKTTFKVVFKPSVKGTRHASIHITSNDADENPFDVKLTGQGVRKGKSDGDDDGDDD